jgi:uncharacterized membrane protein HdeD (DUF308 family)
MMIEKLCNQNNFAVGFDLFLVISGIIIIVCGIIEIIRLFKTKINWYKVWEDFQGILAISAILIVGFGSILGSLWLIGWLIKLIVC